MDWYLVFTLIFTVSHLLVEFRFDLPPYKRLITPLYSIVYGLLWPLWLAGILAVIYDDNEDT